MPLGAGSRASPKGEARRDPAEQGWGPDGLAGGAGRSPRGIGDKGNDFFEKLGC